MRRLDPTADDRENGHQKWGLSFRFIVAKQEIAQGWCSANRCNTITAGVTTSGPTGKPTRRSRISPW